MLFKSPTCVYCGERATCVDHIRPKIKGGTNHESNLVPACQICNSSKGKRLLTEWSIRNVLFAVPRDVRVFSEILHLTNRYDLLTGKFLTAEDQIRIASIALQSRNRRLVTQIVQMYESNASPTMVIRKPLITSQMQHVNRVNKSLKEAKTTADRVRIAIQEAHTPGTEASIIAQWLAERGYQGVSPNYVRNIRSYDLRKTMSVA